MFENVRVSLVFYDRHTDQSEKLSD